MTEKEKPTQPQPDGPNSDVDLSATLKKGKQMPEETQPDTSERKG